ncbi:hypothetical protein BC937DRAFT_91482 [Endogone sp. FLAS-F59071]|nr:hypothetical protein BC937DRAFT_91482 [Endogone sp. FLAS-F59071]|eukprot:RUS16223.1 hypothetical protein BC937DRAFT_91482 [Endogone sp. FLAS-F59071]
MLSTHESDSQEPIETVEIFVVHHIIDIPDEPSIFQKLNIGMRNAADDIVARLKSVGTKVYDAAGKVQEAAENIEDKTKQRVFDVEHRFQNVGNRIQHAIQDVEESAKNGVHSVEHCIGNICEKMQNTARQGVYGVGHKLGDLGSRVRNTIESVQDVSHTEYAQATEAVHKGIDEMKETAYEAEEATRSAFSDLVHRLQMAGGTLVNWGSTLTHKAVETKDRIHDKLEDRLEEQMEPFFTVPSKLQEEIEESNARALRGDSDVPISYAPKLPEILHDFSDFDNKMDRSIQQLQHYWDGRKTDITNAISGGRGYTPLTGFYGAFLTLYFLILSYRVWMQRKRTSVFLGDGTLETVKALRDNVTVHKAGSRAKVFEQPTITDYTVLARLSEAYNTFSTYVPFALLVCGLAELNGVMRVWMHTLYLMLVAGTLLTVEAGASGLDHDPFNLGRKEVGLWIVWAVIVTAGTGCAKIWLMG